MGNKKKKKEKKISNAKVYFDSDIETELEKLIKDAKKSIYLAMAWNTSTKLIDALLEQSKIVEDKIRIILDSSRSNYDNKYTQPDKRKRYKKGNWAFFNKKDKEYTIKENIEFYIYHIPSKYYAMHNKFCVIDSKIVISGSYNWSTIAPNNRENIVVLKSKKIAEKFINQFDELIDTKIDGHICDKIEDRKKYKKIFKKRD